MTMYIDTQMIMECTSEALHFEYFDGFNAIGVSKNRSPKAVKKNSSPSEDFQKRKYPTSSSTVRTFYRISSRDEIVEERREALTIQVPQHLPFSAR